MSNSSPVEDLLTLMPRFAEAVNAFDSDAVREKALEALLDAARLGPAPATPVDEGVPGTSAKGTRVRRSASGSRAAGQRERRTAPTLVKDLNLRPPGKPSFADLVSEKKPGNQHERGLVAVHYLTSVLGRADVGVDEVFTCFKDRTWKIPNNLSNALQLTASKKGWLDTSDMAHLKVAIPGDNHLTHDMPATKTSK